MPAIHLGRRLLAVVLALFVSMAVLPVDDASAHTRKLRNRIINVANNQAGDPYQYGSDGPNAFDCSGFTQFVFKRVGLQLPRVSDDQYAATRHIRKSKLRRGDMVFFHSGGDVYHVSIYAGNGYVWHSPSTGSVVHKSKLWTTSWYAGRVRH